MVRSRRWGEMAGSRISRAGSKVLLTQRWRKQPVPRYAATWRCTVYTVVHDDGTTRAHKHARQVATTNIAFRRCSWRPAQKVALQRRANNTSTTASNMPRRWSQKLVQSFSFPFTATNNVLAVNQNLSMPPVHIGNFMLEMQTLFVRWRGIPGTKHRGAMTLHLCRVPVHPADERLDQFDLARKFWQTGASSGIQQTSSGPAMTSLWGQRPILWSDLQRHHWAKLDLSWPVDSARGCSPLGLDWACCRLRYKKKYKISTISQFRGCDLPLTRRSSSITTRWRSASSNTERSATVGFRTRSVAGVSAHAKQALAWTVILCPRMCATRPWGCAPRQLYHATVTACISIWYRSIVRPRVRHGEGPKRIRTRPLWW